MDFSFLKTFINEKVNISEEEFEQIADLVYLKNFKKNEIIINQGEVCRFIGFLNNGLIRSYYYDDNGKEITTKFFFENCLFFRRGAKKIKTACTTEITLTLLLSQNEKNPLQFPPTMNKNK